MEREQIGANVTPDVLFAGTPSVCALLRGMSRPCSALFTCRQSARLGCWASNQAAGRTISKHFDRLSAWIWSGGKTLDLGEQVTKPSRTDGGTRLGGAARRIWTMRLRPPRAIRRCDVGGSRQSRKDRFRLPSVEADRAQDGADGLVTIER